MKTKVSITIDEDLLNQIEELAKKQGINRSLYMEKLIMQHTRQVPVLILATDAKINGKDKAKPLVQHQLDYLKNEGFTEIFVSTDSLELKKYLEKEQSEINIIFEKQKIGSGGSLSAHAEKIGRRFIFMYCDELYELDLQELVKFHLRNKAGLTLVLQSAAKPSQYGVAVLEGSSVLRFEEKPGKAGSHLIFTGVGVIDIPVARKLKKGKFELQLNNVENKYGYIYEGYWKTFDIERDFK